MVDQTMLTMTVDGPQTFVGVEPHVDLAFDGCPRFPQHFVVGEELKPMKNTRYTKHLDDVCLLPNWVIFLLLEYQY